MSEAVDYAFADGIARITIDDGKANAMSPDLLAAIDGALDQAEADDAVVVLRGRSGIFSGGFDLSVFQSGDGAALVTMLRRGGQIVHRLATFPRPVLGACTGHAMAQGAFMLMACDVRIGLGGDFRFGMNEVAIGLVVPHYAVEICRHRMSPTAFDLALGTATLVDPGVAREWGILDHVAADDDAFEALVDAEAARLATVVPEAFRGTRERVRGPVTARLLDLVDGEFPAP